MQNNSFKCSQGTPILLKSKRLKKTLTELEQSGHTNITQKTAQIPLLLKLK